jgi:hypothetical protein
VGVEDSTPGQLELDPVDAWKGCAIGGLDAAGEMDRDRDGVMPGQRPRTDAALEEDAFLSALDSGSAQMLGTVLPAFRRAKTWEESVRAAYEAMFSFGIEEPEYTTLGAVEMYTVGRRALQTRDTVMEGLEALLVPGYELTPDTPPIAAEAIGGAIYALIYDQVKNNGPESLPELAPMATYMTLAPFVGAEQAYERAIEESEKW